MYTYTLYIHISVQTQVISPGQDELKDPQAMDHLAENCKPETS